MGGRPGGRGGRRRAVLPPLAGGGRARGGPPGGGGGGGAGGGGGPWPGGGAPGGKRTRQGGEWACRSPPWLRRWRRCLPEDAPAGLAPHSAAKLASVRSRPGLSPAVASSVAATWVPTPFFARNPAGAACSASASSEASSWVISAVSTW